MKTIPLLLFLAFCMPLARANRIDDLHTRDEVLRFLQQEVGGYYKQLFGWKPTVTDTSRYGDNTFFKVDFDQNGLTDLLVSGSHLFAITDQGGGDYGVHFIDLNKHNSKVRLLEIFKGEEAPLIEVEIAERYPDRSKPPHYAPSSILIFRYGHFMEYNPEPDHWQIERIQYATSNCYDKNCRGSSVTINADQTVTYEAWLKGGNQPRVKRLRTKLDTVVFKRIMNTINDMNMENLQDVYNVNRTHAGYAKLEISYDNGQVKRILDEGMTGTFGLENLYRQLMALRKTQRWKKNRVRDGGCILIHRR